MAKNVVNWEATKIYGTDHGKTQDITKWKQGFSFQSFYIN